MTIEELTTMEPQELARVLHIPILKAYLELEVKDKDGKVIERRKQPAHSWVRNMYNLLFTQAAGVAADSADNLSLKDPAGTVKSSATKPAHLTGEASSRGSASQDVEGVLVGTGSIAEDFEQYQLQTKISDGTGAGELSYVADEDGDVSTIDTTKKEEHVRYFNNNSGGAITVNEVGLFYYLTGPVATRYMLCRDLVSPGVEVPDTGQLRVTYTIELTYPS